MREGGGRALEEALRLNTTVTSLNRGGDYSLNLSDNDLQRAEGGRWQKHCASTPPLRRSTLASMTWDES